MANAATLHGAPHAPPGDVVTHELRKALSKVEAPEPGMVAAGGRGA